MPELPEVEVTRMGIAPALVGRTVSAVSLRAPALRYPLPAALTRHLKGRTLAGIARRGKYLLLDFGTGTVLLHLGMSGTLRLLPRRTPAGKHDHVDIVFDDLTLRLNDPRRFGALLWLEGDPLTHALLADLGMEPLARSFTARALQQRLAGRSAAIKLAIMDAHVVVGVGNIYAAEALFRAGGSTLRDFFGCDGDPGHFQLEHQVYGREGEPCRKCGTKIRQLRQGQRSTYFCPKCQR